MLMYLSELVDLLGEQEILQCTDPIVFGQTIHPKIKPDLAKKLKNGYGDPTANQIIMYWFPGFKGAFEGNKKQSLIR